MDNTKLSCGVLEETPETIPRHEKKTRKDGKRVPIINKSIIKEIKTWKVYSTYLKVYMNCFLIPQFRA